MPRGTRESFSGAARNYGRGTIVSLFMILVGGSAAIAHYDSTKPYDPGFAEDIIGAGVAGFIITTALSRAANRQSRHRDI